MNQQKKLKLSDNALVFGGLDEIAQSPVLVNEN